MTAYSGQTLGSGLFHRLRYVGQGTMWHSSPRVLSRGSLSKDYTTHVQRSKQKDLYAVLGVTPAATQGQIKAAYYELSKRHHPDRNKGSDESHRQFSELTSAYEVLGSYHLRRKYDKGLLYDHPNPRPQHHHSPTHHTSASTMHGKKVKFDFDAFYKAHYGQTLRRRRKEEFERKMEAEQAALRTLTDIQQAGLRVVVIAMVLAAGYVGNFYMRARSKMNQ